MKHPLAALLSVLAIQATTANEHWNQFRGPQGNGMSTATNLPVEFDERANVRWKVVIPESGWSSPVVWDNEIWLTTGSDEKKELRVICVDLESGKIVKDIKAFDMIERKVDPAYAFDSSHMNSPATPTPVVEEERLFVSFWLPRHRVPGPKDRRQDLAAPRSADLSAGPTGIVANR